MGIFIYSNNYELLKLYVNTIAHTKTLDFYSDEAFLETNPWHQSRRGR